MPYSLRVWSAIAVAMVAVSTPSVGQQSRDPDDLIVALGLIERGLHADAIPRLESFLREHPRHRRVGEGFYRLGVCLLETGQSKHAVDALERALRTRGFELLAEARYRLAVTRQELGQLDRAVAEFATLLDKTAEDHYLRAAGHFGHGECERDRGNDERAVRSFLAAADAGERIGGDAERYAFFGGFQAGLAYLRMEQFGRASKVFRLLRERHARHEQIGDVLYFAGDAAYRQGQRDDAASAWQQAIEHGTSHAADAKYGLAWCRADAGDARGALQWFERVVREHGDAVVAKRAQLEVGRLAHKAGDHERAVKVLAALVDDAEVGGQALEIRAAALLASGDAEAAKASFEKVASVLGGVEGARAQYGLGESLAQNGDWQGALKAYERAMQTEDEQLRGDAAYARIVALHELGDYERSARAAAAFMRKQPAHPMAQEASFARAENLFALERYDESLRAYAGLPEDHPRRSVAAFKAAWSALLSGDAADAAKRFAACAGDDALDAAMREEALSMVALARHESGDDDGALEAADRYRARYRDGAHLARTEQIAARVLRARGQLDAAKKRLARASSAGAGENQAHLELEQADVLFQEGDFERAGAAYRAAAGTPGRVGARALEGLAWCAFELGDDRACLGAIRRGREHEGVDAAILAGLDELEISVMHRAERWDDAQRAAREFLRRHGDHERADHVRYALGVAQLRGGDARGARKTLRELAESMPTERVFYELAWACKKSEDADGAVRAFDRVAELSQDPDVRGEALFETAVARIESDRDAARERLSRVEGRYRGRALYRLGFLALEDEDLSRALRRFEELVALGRDEELYFEGCFMFGETALLAGKPDAAVVPLGDLLKRAPKHDRAHRARLYFGEAAATAGEHADAISALERFLADSDRDADALDRARANLWLGRAHAGRSDHERADQAFAAAADLSDGEIGAEAQFRLGEVRRARGDQKAAIDAYLKLSILFAHEPWVPRGLEAAAQCYDELGDRDKAERFRRELVERFPNSKQARRAKPRR